MAKGRILGGGAFDCNEGNGAASAFQAYTTGYPPPPHSPKFFKLLELDVSNPCLSPFEVFVYGTDGSFTSIAIPAGVTTNLGAPQLLPAGLFTLNLGGLGGGTAFGFTPCELNTNFIVQLDGTLAPWSTVCP